MKISIFFVILKPSVTSYSIHLQFKLTLRNGKFIILKVRFHFDKKYELFAKLLNKRERSIEYFSISRSKFN